MEREEWKIIYEMYQRQLFLYALSLTKNVQDAEDLVQETFIKAFLSYERTGSIKCWLVTVLKHEFFNLCRKRRREVLDDGEVKRDVSEETIVDEMIEKEERRNLFFTAREILMESIYFQLKDEEIAKMHKITQVNVRKIRSRAKQKLIKRLEGEL